jgi:hypothetical protein
MTSQCRRVIVTDIKQASWEGPDPLGPSDAFVWRDRALANYGSYRFIRLTYCSTI